MTEAKKKDDVSPINSARRKRRAGIPPKDWTQAERDAMNKYNAEAATASRRRQGAQPRWSPETAKHGTVQMYEWHKRQGHTLRDGTMCRECADAGNAARLSRAKAE